MKRLVQRFGWWLQGVGWPSWDEDPTKGWRGRVYRLGVKLNNV